MTKKNIFKITGITTIAAIAAISILLSNETIINSSNTNNKTERGTSLTDFFSSTTFFRSKKLDIETVLSESPKISLIIDKLQKRYNNKLSDKSIQVKLLGGLIRYIKRSNPHDWDERVKIIVIEKFPEHSVELLDKLEKLKKYYKFITDNKDELQSLSYDGRKERIIEKRQELFGDEYNEIWRNAIAKERMTEILSKLNYKINLSFDEKILEYKSLTNDIYSSESDKSLGKTNTDIMIRNYDLTKKFLGLPSIQAELDTMEPNERARYLRKIRKSMGLKEDVIKKMEETDILRDELWKNGTEYNKKRKQIMATYSGKEREENIIKIREKYFGKNAAIIQYEEETFKFYRFQYPRRYGRD